jgi:hypothetical protein
MLFGFASFASARSADQVDDPVANAGVGWVAAQYSLELW